MSTQAGKLIFCLSSISPSSLSTSGNYPVAFPARQTDLGLADTFRSQHHDPLDSARDCNLVFSRLWWRWPWWQCNLQWIQTSTGIAGWLTRRIQGGLAAVVVDGPLRRCSRRQGRAGPCGSQVLELRDGQDPASAAKEGPQP